MSDAESEQSSVPPDPNPTSVPAAAHQGDGANGAPMHPVWQAAAGRAQSSAARKPVGGTSTPIPTARYAPISSLALELRVRQEMDGASSVGSVQGDKSTRRRKSSSGAKNRKKRVRDYDDDEEDERDEDERDEEEDGDDDGDDVGSDVLAGAAFGGGARPRRRRTRVEPSCASSDGEDACSMASSAIRRECEHESRHVASGCVACTQPSKVVVVDEFVQKNCDKMAESELFKMAGLVYEDKVVGPARAEGVAVPRWDWRTIAVHYRFHRLDVRFRRCQIIRSLGKVQERLELSLMRVDEDGNDHVDKDNFDRLMKTVQQHSREVSLLHDANLAARPRGAR